MQNQTIQIVHTHLITFIFKFQEFSLLHACSNSVYTFKSHLNLSYPFQCFPSAYRAVICGVDAHVYNSLHDLAEFRQSARGNLKQNGKTRRKESVTHINMQQAHICRCAIQAGSGDRPDDERLMKAYTRFV
ncbi:Hypothetical_protein [Hexamita inflata]|uniref:Hypothetical_protein n=1 Tax=Hexamita inflata TaxID=28002 RepID=A0AA86V1Q5_9EUKA|nr:Hypothetical protein HINF_LOCUS60407 [Hexamita inflata]